MFGLKYILQTYGMTNSELANKLLINRANISMWIKQKEIPTSKLQELQNIFPNIPKNYFNKELKKSEMLHIQEAYFTETDEIEEIEITHIDEETGKEILIPYTISQNYGVISQIREDSEKEELIERIQELIQTNDEKEDRNQKMLKRFISYLEENDSRHIDLLKMVFHFLSLKDEWGIDPTYDAPKGREDRYKQFGQFLKKYNYINETWED